MSEFLHIQLVVFDDGRSVWVLCEFYFCIVFLNFVKKQEMIACVFMFLENLVQMVLFIMKFLKNNCF